MSNLKRKNSENNPTDVGKNETALKVEDTGKLWVDVILNKRLRLLLLSP
jgi:hypothetical protein